MKRVIAAGILLALFATPAFAASKGTVRVANVERHGDGLRFTVVTPGGPRLADGDFRVSVNSLRGENIVASPIKATERASGAVLVVDTSGSMEGEPIEAARRAVGLFANTVEPETQIALISFASNERVLSGYSSDKAKIASLGRALKARGETAVHDALLAAISLAERRGEEQRNVVLLSDGTDTASATSISAVRAAALAAKVRVYIVGLKSPDYQPRSIKGIADATKGKLLVTSSPDRLATLFGDIARTLVSRYELEVSNPDPLATQVEVHVQVVQDTGIESGSGLFEIGPPPLPGGKPGLPLDKVPPAAAAGLIFIALALASFVGIETLRIRRSSPGPRVSWYLEAEPEKVDKEAMVSAAVLERAKEIATQLAERAGYLERLEGDLDSAGIKWRGGEVLVASAGLAFAGAALGFALMRPYGALLFGVVGMFGPIGFIKFTVIRRRAAFYAQLPDVLLLMSGALKAGHSIQQAFAAVAHDAKAPASEEFGRAMVEIRLGAGLDDALQALAKRIGIVDFDWTILAIQIQREVGGNLAEILEIISETIRERDSLRREIKTLTAEGRMSAWVLGLLPIAMATVLAMRSPEYLKPLYTTGTGLTMLGVTGAMMVAGVFWMRKIIKIEV